MAPLTLAEALVTIQSAGVRHNLTKILLYRAVEMSFATKQGNGFKNLKHYEQAAATMSHVAGSQLAPLEPPPVATIPRSR